MSYHDPYSNKQHYTDDEFNPYLTSHQVHPSYDQSGSGYDMTPGPSTGPQRHDTVRSTTGTARRNPPIPTEKVRDTDEISGFDRGEFTARYAAS